VTRVAADFLFRVTMTTTMRLASVRTLSSSLSLLLLRTLPTRAWIPHSSVGVSFYLSKMEENGGRKMSSFSSSSSSNNPTSAEELRRKRLAALSGPSASYASTTSKTTSPGVASSNTKVVNLCESSDDEDLLKQFYQQKKKRAEDAENKRPAKKQKSATTLSKTEGAKKVSTSKKSQAVKKAASTTKPASLSSSNDDTTRFQVATWNVWFGPPHLGGGEPHASARMKALARHLIRAHDPSNNNPLLAIGFQEVIEELAVHLFPLLKNAGYQVFRQPGAPYGCALAVYTKGNNSCTVLDASWQPYQETQMMRGFLYARLELPFSGKQVLFCTTHLESWTGQEYTGSQQRVRQLKELEAFCNDQLETYSSLQTAIMTGDMNWDDERPRTAGNDPVMANVLTTTWQDSWLSTRTGRETCYTYDAKLNPMLGGSLRRRFDRCLVRNASSGSVETLGTRLVGTEALVSLTWQKYNTYSKTYREVPTAPSDHFGLVVQMTT